jgi:hypothetical protein
MVPWGLPSIRAILRSGCTPSPDFSHGVVNRDSISEKSRVSSMGCLRGKGVPIPIMGTAATETASALRKPFGFYSFNRTHLANAAVIGGTKPSR